MDESARKFFQILGIIFVIILFIKYVLPIIFGILGVALTLLVTVLFWVALAVGILVILSYAIKYFRK